MGCKIRRYSVFCGFGRFFVIGGQLYLLFIKSPWIYGITFFSFIFFIYFETFKRRFMRALKPHSAVEIFKKRGCRFVNIERGLQLQKECRCQLVADSATMLAWMM
jgi:hypothetical protein